MNDAELKEHALTQVALKRISALLKSGDFAVAMGTCEDAISGEVVIYKILNLSDEEKMPRFAAEFNELMTKYSLRAAYVIGRVNPDNKESFLINTGGDKGMTYLVNSWAPKDAD